MYDMYPEWGPAAQVPERPLPQSDLRRTHRRWEPQPAGQPAPDPRDSASAHRDDH